MFLVKFLIFVILSIKSTEGKGQYVQPLNMGMQIAIPYDIANIFNRPVWFGRTSAILTTISLLCIIFFGVITSPFGYFFGVPSEKYVLGDNWQNFTKTYGPSGSGGRSLGSPHGILDLKKDVLEWGMPSVKSESCRELVLCSAHKGLLHFPTGAEKFIRFLTKNIIGTSNYEESITKGLSAPTECDYPLCKDSLFGILIRHLTTLMPKWTRRKANH